MDPQRITTERPKLTNKNHKRLVAFIVVLLSLLVICGVGYSVYTWQQNVRLVGDLSKEKEDNKKLRDENIALQDATKDISDEQQGTPSVSDQELAQQAAQDFVDAQVLDMKYIATPPEIKGGFASSGVTSSNQPNHIVSGLLLKKANGNWVVIHHGQNGPDQDTITRFAIPEEFRS